MESKVSDTKVMASAIHLNTQVDSAPKLSLIERCAARCARLQGYSLSSCSLMFGVSASGIGYLARTMSRGFPRPPKAAVPHVEGRAELRRLTAADQGCDVDDDLDLIEMVITRACQLLAGRIDAAEKMHGRRRFLSERAA